MRSNRKLNKNLQTFKTSEALSACEEQASRVFKAITKFEKLLGGGALPTYWGIDLEWRSTDKSVRDYDIYHDQTSRYELEDWAVRGGRIEMMRSQGYQDLVVVRLISPKRGASCFGASFCTKKGRGFAIVENEIVCDGKALRAFLKSKKAQLFNLDDGNLEFEFRDAPCVLTRPWKQPNTD